MDGVDFCQKSDIGCKRELNEDNCGNCISADAQVCFYMVADGMGGHSAGEVASKIAVDFVMEAAAYFTGSNEENISFFIRKVLNQANEKIIETAWLRPECSGMGTTAVLCAVTGMRAVIGNVGDSRAYIVDKNGCGRQITKDHSYIESLIRMGSIDREMARLHPKRNQITKALGFYDEENAVDVFTCDFTRGDTLLLCTDGLNSMVADDKIYKIISEGNSADAICSELLECAKINGGADNITVIVIRN